MLLCTTNPSNLTRLKNILILLLFLIPLHFLGDQIYSTTGSARGEAEAVFFLSSDKNDIFFPSININGFSQSAQKTKNGTFVEIKITADSLRIDKEWRMNKAILKKLKKLDPKRAESLNALLSRAYYIDEAAISIFYFIRNNWKYVEKNDADLTIDEILNLKEASCLSLCRICKFYFDIVGIQSSIVIGIKFPTDEETFVLKGGALHSWIKIKIDKDNEVFCDPLSFFGFVTQRYIYLLDYEDFNKDKLQSFHLETVKLISSRDRIFYNPESEIKPLFWKRSAYESSVYGVVVGKVLNEKEIPAKGSVIVKGCGKDLKTDLFEGNFYFFVREEGTYSIFINFEDGKVEKLGDLVFSGSAVKKIVFYVKEKTSQ